MTTAECQAAAIANGNDPSVCNLMDLSETPGATVAAYDPTRIDGPFLIKTSLAIIALIWLWKEFKK